MNLSNEVKVLYLAIGQNKTIQYSTGMIPWKDWKATSNCILGSKDYFWRIKPEFCTRTIEYPAPCTESNKLVLGQNYYLPVLLNDRGYDVSTYTGLRVDSQWLKRGLIHLTKENAIAHSKALLGEAL